MWGRIRTSDTWTPPFTSAALHTKRQPGPQTHKILSCLSEPSFCPSLNPNSSIFDKMNTSDLCMNVYDICFIMINRKIFLGKWKKKDWSFYNLFFGLNLCLWESGQEPEPGKPITGWRLEHRCNWTSTFIILALAFIDWCEVESAPH